jgi:hypothetical protein
MRLLRENSFSIDAAYWHRAAFVTLSSMMNSFHRAGEQRRFDSQVARTDVPPPLFILGHWRTGTTHLHNLLALDSDQFAFANTYQVVNPHTFLSTEAVNTRRFAWMVPDKRPMDNMELSFEAPQEDEFAPCLMTRLSLYLGISFPRREEHYGRYLTFRGVPREEVDAWKEAFLWFLKKLTFKHQKPLVLKSPPHTARIKMLLEMFPDARFVHIHRHPYAVFQSFQHYFDTAAWYAYLQRPDLAAIDDRIIERYNALHDAFFEERSLIPEGQFYEIRFGDLEHDPFGEMMKIYENLGLGGFEQFAPKLRRHLATLASYRKNRFCPLDAVTRQKVFRAWQRSFEAWGYSSTDETVQ